MEVSVKPHAHNTFTRVVGIWTLVFVLTGQALYPLSSLQSTAVTFWVFHILGFSLEGGLWIINLHSYCKIFKNMEDRNLKLNTNPWETFFFFVIWCLNLYHWQWPENSPGFFLKSLNRNPLRRSGTSATRKAVPQSGCFCPQPEWWLINTDSRSNNWCPTLEECSLPAS